MRISFLYGVRFGMWIRLLRENRFRIYLFYLHRALLVTLVSLKNSFVARREQKRYGAQIAATKVEEGPIFILGHWRSGTTHLHYLLDRAPDLAGPTTYQVAFPETFLLTEEKDAPKIGRMVPKKRPQDNMAQSMALPNEDELAMSALNLLSPYLAWAFPNHEERYMRLLTLRDVSPEVRDAWKSGFYGFAQKLTLKHGCGLVFKSPPHTCRIKLLLEVFPKARFVNIHRDPYRVFQSSLHLYNTWLDHFAFLQRPAPDQFPQRILSLYREMYDVFFEERGDVPEGQYYDMRFTDLEAEPVKELSRMYDALRVPGFEKARPNFETYLEGTKSYSKNTYVEMDPAQRERVAREWARSFEMWGYES